MCAYELELDAGVEGHEYKVVEENLDAQHKSLVADDSDEDDNVAIISNRNTKRIRRTIMDTPESNSDSE